MTKPLVYVAGPYTNGDPVVNTRAAVEMGEELIALGVLPVIPHLSLLWHFAAPHPVEFWYEYDLAVLARCDALYRMPGRSTGADREVEHALDLGLPVLDSLSDLRKWANNR
jgi:hypothetical protein